MNILSLFAIYTWLILFPVAHPPLVTIEWFPIDSDATKIVNYWYDNSSWDRDMIVTFIQENWWLDINTISKTKDYGLCQLQYNRTKRVWIDDPRRLSWRQYQAQVCLWKRQHVANKNIRSAYKIRFLAYKKIKIWSGR